MKIILFEDSQGMAEELLLALNKAVAGKGEASLFEPAPGTPPAGTHEARLKEELSLPRYRDASLIVVDLDLSKVESYRGLSEPTVRRVTDALGTPECAYARGEEIGDEFVRVAEQRESTIALSVKAGSAKFARHVVSVAEGFGYIADQLPTALKEPRKKFPGKLLATILGKPEYSEKIALYASGDQNRLASVLRVGGTDEERRRRLTCLLGYWLWDSVLRYPGVVVNEVAASSYLNIHEDTFRRTGAVQALFEKARYRGPFAEAKGLMWWRGMLDDIVAESGLADGREFAAKQLQQEVPRSECCEDPARPAGYYCMLSEKPVSLENSKGGLTWFPRGADLARVSAKKFEELGPWL